MQMGVILAFEKWKVNALREAKVIGKLSGEFRQQMSRKILHFRFGMRCLKHQFDGIGSSSRVFLNEIKPFVCVQIL